VAAAGALATRRLSARAAGVRRALSWREEVAQLVDDLADGVMGDLGDEEAIAERCRRVVRGIGLLPGALRRSVVRLPACFHHFDQRPEDLELLTERFSNRGDDRDRPLLVAGVRTSGSYLAPLIAAALRRRGHVSVGGLTLRPGRELSPAERAQVRAVVQRGGQILLTDDPPVSGASLVKAAGQFERLGASRTAIVLLLALDEGVPPPALEPYRSVILGSDEWAVNARLDPEAVRSELAWLLAEELEVDAVRELPLPGGQARRAHHRALFRVTGRDPAEDERRELCVLASGVGVGYLGAHQLGVARALSGFVPRILGLRDGILYREWIPSERRLLEEGELAMGAASYVAARQHRLSAGRDSTTAMVGQRPVWEVAGLVLGGAFGRGAPAARVMLVDPAVRKLLHVAEPSVIDGSMTPEHWFAGEDGQPLKVGFSDRTYWNLGLACSDPIYDLAGVGVFARDEALADRVRVAWQELGEEVDSERWLLYELAHLWGRRQADPAHEPAVRHASARSVQRYFAEAFLADLDRAESGPLVALDIDGVLETDQLGFPTLTRASATALRALIAHRHRPVLVTGRGLEEVRDRCRSYGLTAGVAEYGSVLCLDGGARTVVLVDDQHNAALRRLRAALSERDGVTLDPAYAHALRAYRLGANGYRRPLSAAEVAECLNASATTGMVQVIQGAGQSDFVAAGIDKGIGLRTLADALGGEGGKPAAVGSQIALAVGDTSSDAPMLALGEAALVPAQAPAEALASGALRLRRSYQAGLSLAVEQLIGHRPGRCACCRIAPEAPRRRLLIDLFSIAEAGPRGVPPRVLRFVRSSLRAERHP
jgi:hydroxymethylpyrimidine pyrophosphatase-like HAD family hydrolase